MSSSALATGVCLLSLHLADAARYAAEARRGCGWLRDTQHSDGGWGDAVVDGSNLNSTAFALAALQLCARDESARALTRGYAFIERAGGLAALRDRSRCSLAPVVLTLWAVAGLCSWQDVPRLPLELALFPQAARRRVAFTVPAVFALGLLHARVKTVSAPLRALARPAEPRALGYLEDCQGSNGGYQESPLLNGVVYVGLRCAGLAGRLAGPVAERVAGRCLGYIADTQRANGSWTCERDLELSVTTLIVDALDAAGHLDEVRLRDTARWLLDRQTDVPFPATGCPPGAWTWGYPSGWPDTEDTAGALCALLRLGIPATSEPVSLGYGWLAAMQNRAGSWAMFVRNSRITIDRPCPALTARVLMAFHRRDHGSGEHARRALEYLRRVQRPDGSYRSLWFRNHTYATAVALEAHAMCDQPDGPASVRCARWLLDNQNDDGSWGGRGGQPGTAEETGSALAALASTGLSAPASHLDRAARWLIGAQQPDGSWIPAVLGVYYSSLWYSSDHLANAFALRGLGRYRQNRS